MSNMNSSVHKGTGRSSGIRVLLRMSGGFLQICLNIFIYAVIIFFVVKAVHYTYDFAYRIFGDVSVEVEPGRDVKILILKGESTMNVATKLETNKLIPDRYSFFLKVQIGNFGSDENKKKYEIMGGTYVLNTSMNYDEILAVITDAKNSIEGEISVEEAENSP
ncbi:MAG: endolytic transglycosylase MltG [Lachnospiraceae bacterium]|nr:endolytic transglycosylase MltG [Lachnospiraceae bacterium]